MSFGAWIVRRSLAAAAVCSVVLTSAAAVAQQFPFDQVLVLEASRIGPLKRVPVMTIEADGRASIDLWCKTVPALLQVGGAQIKIETAPLPDALPLYMSSGQCSPERMQADVDLLATLTQATDWQRQGDRIVLTGPSGTPLRFRLSSH